MITIIRSEVCLVTLDQPSLVGKIARGLRDQPTNVAVISWMSTVRKWTGISTLPARLLKISYWTESQAAVKRMLGIGALTISRKKR